MIQLRTTLLLKSRSSVLGRYFEHFAGAMSKHARSSSQEDVLRHPSTKVAKQIDEHQPMKQLEGLLKEQKSSHVPRNVLHWFRSKDIRMEDNKALEAASKLVQDGKGSLITCYLISFEDMEWHGTSPARSDFILESVRTLKDQLEAKNIPLAILVAEERSEKTDKLLNFVKKHDISHVFANFEYEVDELRRDIKITKRIRNEVDIAIELFHDQTIVVPGALKTGGGGPHKVFTPYHRDWLAEVRKHPELLECNRPIKENAKSATGKFEALFHTSIPDLPENKKHASDEERKRHRKLWPAGHEAGLRRLKEFLQKKVITYARDRSEPAKDPSSRLSPYFASGVISVREAVSAAKKANGGNDCDDSGDPGIASWVREIVFREFYRHTMVNTPHGGMNLPQNLKFDFVEWEDDEEGWKKWCEGKTGVPFVDAGMRQLNYEAYMHNRLRMNVSSYLSANLLIDYRRGERYFAEHLIDWDLCSKGITPNDILVRD